MRAETLKGLGAIVLVAVCAGAALALQESPPPSPPKEDSVAEAARKAKAARAKAKPRKVYTEEDLPGLKRDAVSTVGEESAAAPPEGEASVTLPLISLEAAPGVPPAERDETYWRERAGKLRSEIVDADQQIASLKDEIAKGGGAGFDAFSGASENVIYIRDRNVRLQRLEQRRAELQKQMEALLDEARKAGVPPGWLR